MDSLQIVIEYVVRMQEELKMNNFFSGPLPLLSGGWYNRVEHVLQGILSDCQEDPEKRLIENETIKHGEHDCEFILL